ncbi:MAG TPA: hypothetical protein VLB46_03935 [Pyrinomonadaceae bacterium]|nr:hypothetical protein [Pyrinomonadaceae bacterium]
MVNEDSELIASTCRLPVINPDLGFLKLVNQPLALVLGEDTSCDQRLHPGNK